MKKKNIVLLALSALAVVGLGGAALLTMPKASSEVKASGESYYLVGSHNSWDLEDKTTTVVEGADAIGVTFTAEQEFKFHLGTDWTGELNENALRGNARGYFVDADPGAANSNIKCLADGTYMVSIKEGLLYIDFISINKTDVYFQLSGWTNCYAYVYDNTTASGINHEPFGGFPGTLITDITTGVDFAPNYSAGGGLGKIAIPYKTLGNTKLIFSDGGNVNKTKDLPLSMGAYYLQNTDSVTYVSGKGSAASVVFAWDHAIQAAADHSLCNLTIEQATQCLNLLSSSTGTVFTRNSTFWTWSDKTKTSSKNFTGAEIEETLNAIKDGTLALTFSPNETSSTPLWIALGSLALGGAAFGFFYLRKKRAQ